MSDFKWSGVCALLIECDNTNSLGGSCVRDLFNIYNFLKSKNVNLQNIYILTNNPTYFKKRNIANVSNNSINEFEKILKNKTANSSCVFIHISGHGYQGTDKNNLELDMKCEQIVLSSGIMRDCDFNNLLIQYLPKSMKVRISVDTCHSGSFSNFRYQLKLENKKIVETKKQGWFTDAYSISACKDNELDSCDIGNIAGFGGSLTVHLLDQQLIDEFFTGNPITVKKKLVPILKLLNQEPIILTDN